MEFITRQVPKNFNIFMAGDVHVGTKLHSYKGFDKLISMMQVPYSGVKHNVLIGMGDNIEAIDSSDKRFDVHSVELELIRPDLQIEHVREKLTPIRKKIVTILEGNHEHKLKRYYDYGKQLCKDLDVPFGTYTAIVQFKYLDELLFKVFATHGYGSINSVAGPPERIKANLDTALKRKLQNKAADCVIMAMGHTHKLIVADPVNSLYVTSENDKLKANYATSEQNANYIHPDHRYYVNTGSFTKLYARGFSGYAERACYDPMEHGFAVAVVRKGKVVSVDKIVL